MAPKLSIVIPVYNVEETLDRSLQSIRSSRPEDVEVIIVDDGSADHTPELLNEYKQRVSFPCRVVRQDNAGVAAARNRGIDEVSGDYLVFLDADDRWEPGALDRILTLADEGADIVGWDFISVGSAGRREIRQADYKTPEEALRNLMGGTMKWNLWLFAVRREFMKQNNLRFLPGADMGEDMQFMLKAFACADSVKQIHESLYRYNASNPASISSKMNERRRGEVTRNLQEVDTFLSHTRHAALCKDYLPHLKLFIKLPLLVSLASHDYETWYSWFPEANGFATRNRALPFRVRLLQGLAARRLWGLVWCYNILVYKMVYPLFFRSGRS